MLKRAREFLRKFPWLSFIIQSPQALFTTTGWLADRYKEVPADERPWYVPDAGIGIILGPLMGMLNDLVWGSLARVAGAPVTFRGPPPADPFGKATRYLTQPPYHLAFPHMYSRDDLALLATADRAAIAILARDADRETISRRARELNRLGVAQYKPWTESALAVLIANGYDPGVEQKQPAPRGVTRVTYGQVLPSIASQFGDAWTIYNAQFQNTSIGTFLHMIMTEGGSEVFSALTEDPDPIKNIFTRAELAFGRMFEFNVFPNAPVFGPHLDVMLEAANNEARALGFQVATRNTLINALNAYMNGWNRDPPGLPRE